jgi:hypothetical protein
MAIGREWGDGTEDGTLNTGASGPGLEGDRERVTPHGGW